MNGGVSGILYKSDNMKRGDLPNFPVLNVIVAGNWTGGLNETTTTPAGLSWHFACRVAIWWCSARKLTWNYSEGKNLLLAIHPLKDGWNLLTIVLGTRPLKKCLTACHVLKAIIGVVEKLVEFALIILVILQRPRRSDSTLPHVLKHLSFQSLSPFCTVNILLTQGSLFSYYQTNAEEGGDQKSNYDRYYQWGGWSLASNKNLIDC